LIGFLIIPVFGEDSCDINDESQIQKNFEPQTITIVLGLNNTVRWINQDDCPSYITSNHDYNGLGFASPRVKYLQNCDYIHKEFHSNYYKE
jgi:hypothetical protein